MAVHFQGNELYSVGAGESETNKKRNNSLTILQRVGWWCDR